jgi:lipoprotein NlpD
VLCNVLLGACADTVGDGPEGYVVRPDDTLYSIAWRHDVDFRDLARWNNIGADFRISVGQFLVLGPGRASSVERQSPAVGAPTPAIEGSRAQDAPQVGKPRPLPESQTSAPIPRASSVPGAPVLGAPNERNAQGGPAPAAAESKWIWPTDRVGSPRPVAGGGILLSGRLGQDVRAASAGRVVYTGSGLRGYGNLIIIKHGDTLLSAYGHNREMLVHDGQDVAMGQVIAHMGEGAQRSPLLYFEIRQNGKPVDPMPFLTKPK